MLQVFITILIVTLIGSEEVSPVKQSDTSNRSMPEISKVGAPYPDKATIETAQGGRKL